jgi:hypothetical protein
VRIHERNSSPLVGWLVSGNNCGWANDAVNLHLQFAGPIRSARQ